MHKQETVSYARTHATQSAHAHTHVQTVCSLVKQSETRLVITGSSGLPSCPQCNGIKRSMLLQHDAVEVVGTHALGLHGRQVGLNGGFHLAPVLQYLLNHLPRGTDLATMGSSIAETCSPAAACSLCISDNSNRLLHAARHRLGCRMGLTGHIMWPYCTAVCLCANACLVNHL